jgi:type IV pilus assembly protein PilC
MAGHPKVFDRVFVSLVAAGEKTGSFAEVFGHLEHHLKWLLDIKNKIKKATYYPIFLLFLMSAVIMIMMIFVIPKLTVFLIAQNIPLPFYTKALIATSNFIVYYWYVIIFGPLFFYFLVKFLCWSSISFAYQIDAFLLSVPFFGTVLKKLELSRFCHFFAITYRSGMGILECLDTAGSVVQNLVIRESIDMVRNAVTEGQKLTDALKSTSQFPSLVVRMFKVGEDSGNLDRSLENVNHFYDQEVNDAVNGFVSFLQPILTLVMGGLLMWITLSVFGPVYSSFGIRR